MALNDATASRSAFHLNVGARRGGNKARPAWSQLAADGFKAAGLTPPPACEYCGQTTW
jgi:hypothetical protein